ncbi:hypothetical protein SLEP1_g3658 [Rubroshorea leprosula]|uniref:Uncharacterized protein n=1 Tax=Rubroshorea leprosula TaxID=152421 RepID=A0AAV5HSL9_9ROSI|nr:hypothetical protein SLEP1_g3658 [Rubroshorea leprosula]
MFSAFHEIEHAYLKVIVNCPDDLKVIMNCDLPVTSACFVSDMIMLFVCPLVGGL